MKWLTTRCVPLKFSLPSLKSDESRLAQSFNCCGVSLTLAVTAFGVIVQAIINKDVIEPKAAWTADNETYSFVVCSCPFLLKNAVTWRWLGWFSRHDSDGLMSQEFATELGKPERHVFQLTII